MKPLFFAALCAAPLLAPGLALADARIREVPYDDRAVVRLDGCFGFQTMIEFAEGERIENVGLGEASQWLVTPNKRANVLFVKPAYRSTHSNMTVATDRRRYSFELAARPTAACARGQVVYDLRFKYPAEPEPAAPPPPVAAAEPVTPAPELRNTAYSFAGSREAAPLRVFDNGRSTWFQWDPAVAAPAVYAVGSDKTETLVNFSARGDYLVADQIAPSFVLRRGAFVATLYNDAYRAPELDAAAPRARAEVKPPPTGLARLFRSSADVR
ncbi:TrbG/VirB9 family P-type conjugative transfer protein [Phenylobacterium aquaticum]|uniref:TrbG/VirB9 family P-type conjugative transfer protein n=1 Tax=Phenylobacterium aquaticum TaxID=1763816 RepID=UPI001F5D4061|nr:TrbG/VirB9 family P-type conjugative transfer protein [Phenylobacterium aquaticum]MCI3131091.1 TrbG/VirB9 family P-type conjugative transfer protein [Phenylobacterium aquaticum]